MSEPTKVKESAVWCIWEDCDQDAIYCSGHACEFCAPELDRLEERNRELVDALEELVNRCDGPEGVRADGSNIQTMRASAILAKERP